MVPSFPIGRLNKLENGGGGGSGTPAVPYTSIQFNNSGVFGGDSLNTWDNTNKTGGTGTTPLSTSRWVYEAPTTTIPPPTSFTATKVIEADVDSPSTATATQVDAPIAPSTVATTIANYIDQVIDNMFTYYQNTMETGFIANGQTITYTIYAYRLVGGVYVTCPNSYSPTAFTDTVNDGTTAFGLDISGWTTTNWYQDGFILSRFDSSTGLTETIDIGSVTSYADIGFTGSQAYVNSTYSSLGSTWIPNVAQYIYIGTSLRTAYVASSGVIDGIVTGAYLILNTTWAAATNDGFIYQSPSTIYTDVSTATSFDDYGQAGEMDFTSFSDLAFPYFNTSLTDASWTSAQVDQNTGSSLVSDGSNYDVYVWEYRTNPLNGQKYVGGAVYSGGAINDGNTSNFITFSGVVVAGDGDGRIVELRTSAISIGYIDIGLATSFSLLDDTNGAFSGTPILADYTGLAHDFSAYGKVVTPSDRYSSTHKDYTFTDTNPVDGYLVKHELDTFGNATNTKVLETAPRATGKVHDDVATTTFYQTYIPLGDSIVTPTNLGFLSDGSTLNKELRLYSSFYSPYLYFSSSYASASTTDTNDGLYYTIDLAWTNASGVAQLRLLLNDNGAGYNSGKSVAGTAYTIDTTSVFYNELVVVTPNSLPGTGITVRSSSISISDAPQLIVKSTASNYAKQSFIGSSGSNLFDILYDPSTSTAQFRLPNGQLAYSTPSVGIFEFHTDVTASYNYTNSSNFLYRVAGSNPSHPLILASTASGQVAINGNGSYSNGSVFSVYAQNSSDDCLTLFQNPNGGYYIKAISGTGSFYINNLGHTFINTSTGLTGNLNIGGQSSSYPMMCIVGGSLATSQNSIQYDGLDLWFSYNGDPTLRKIITSSTGSKLTNKVIPIADSYGNIGDSQMSLSGSTLSFNSWDYVFTNGLSVSASKDLTMGAGSKYLGGIRTSYATRSTTGTLSLATNSPITVFTGSTAGQILTLPTAVSIDGTVFEIVNDASVSVTVNTTSSQTIKRIGTSTSVVLASGDRIRCVSDGANWTATNYSILGIATTWTGIPTFSSGISVTQFTNQTTNGFVKTTGTNGTITIDTNNYYKSGDSANFNIVNSSSLTATRPVKTDGSKNLVSGLINLASANDVTGVLPTANGGTGLVSPNTTDDQTGKTATYTSPTVTVPNDAAYHQYTVGAYLTITAISAGTITITVTYTDETSTSRTATMFPVGLTTAGISATGAFQFQNTLIRAKFNTAINVVSTFAGVSVTYDTGSFINRLN